MNPLLFDIARAALALLVVVVGFLFARRERLAHRGSPASDAARAASRIR